MPPAPEPITFRPLQRADFPLLSRWLRTPHVARWWADDASPAALENDYGCCIDGTEPAEVFITLHEGLPFGFAQRYRLAAYPGYADELTALTPIPDAASGIDYLIGEPNLLHRGFGSALIRAFAQRLWSDDAGASCIVVATHADNAASHRALDAAGFRLVARGELDPDNPADDRRHLVLHLDRP